MEKDNLNELLEDALNDLLDGGEEAKKPPVKEPAGQSTMPDEPESMRKFFESMADHLKTELPQIDPTEAQAKLSESMPQIFDLMQNLLSKELLYPALKDLLPKMDEWLEKNTPTLSKGDRRRYTKQREIIRGIMEVFDDESMSDKERFEKNLDLMEKMQSLGAPPKELTVQNSEFNSCPIM